MSNREIKFRAWHEPSKEMVYFDAVKAANDQYIAKHFFQLMAGTHSYGAGLMQYTGLKDKKGREIYEGDSVRIIGLPLTGEYYPITFDKATFGFFEYYDSSELWPLGNLHSDDVVIVGNIYENPDLIGE
jgi:uncharacterized phage protein (TIGR01671 family)